MAMGRGKAEEWGLPPHMVVLPHPHLAPHDGENFLTPSPPLGASRNPVPSYKTLLFVNLP